jgi:uncharacterized protein (DUF1501 family)
MNHLAQTRREFVRNMLFLTAGASAPFFLTRTVLALDQKLKAAGTRSIPAMPDDRILVVIQLGGGNDGLNTVVPYAMDDYYRARATLGVPAESILKLNDAVGLHPNLAKLKDLYDAGHLAIVQGVGYPNPDRSHFRSMEIWQSGDPGSITAEAGWLGNYLDNTCPGCPDAGRGGVNPVAGVNIGAWMPLALKSRRGLSVAFDNPDALQWTPAAGDENDRKRAETTFVRLNRVVTKNLDDPRVARLDFLSRVAMNAQLSSDRVREVTKKYKGGVTYPATGLGRQLQLVAQMIAGQLDTRVYYVSMGGFDTHANQKGAHERLLTELAEGAAAFYDDLKKQGNESRVLTMTFSEFGRRVAENASGGTDHGAGAPLFVFGGRVNGGVYGPHPGLAADALDRGDVKFHTDFRGVYATILERWLGAKAKPILGADFKPISFV